LTSSVLAERHHKSDAEIKAALRQHPDYQAIIKARARLCFDKAKKKDSNNTDTYDVGSISENVNLVLGSNCPGDIKREFLASVESYAQQKGIEFPATMSLNFRHKAN
jgi:hypothetical protein